MNYINYANHLKAIQNILPLPYDICNIITTYTINQKSIVSQLNITVIYGHLEVFKFVYACGDNFLKKERHSTDRNDYAIIYASSMGNLEIIKFLYQNGIYIKGDYQEEIVEAATNGHLEVVRYILPYRNRGDTDDLNLALYNASKNGYLEIVKLLHINGADITDNNNYAVRLASENGHLEVVKYLHANGADITDDDIRVASKNGHLEVVKYLHANGASIIYAVMDASEHGHLEVIKYLVDAGVDITANNNDAVKTAACYHHFEIVKYLIEEAGATL